MANDETDAGEVERSKLAVAATVDAGSEPTDARHALERSMMAARAGNRGEHKFQPGDELARWVVVEEIGAGGMGVVYSAYDPELARKVAIKLLRCERFTGQASGQAQQRMLREAQALARLTHENVVVVHEVGEIEGRIYLAMEYVDGGTLREWQLGAERDWRSVVAVYCRAGQGLSAAHRAGLVHRDFKPENVLVGHDDRVLVTDFGLVSASIADKPERDELPSAASTPASGGEGLAASLALSEEMTEYGAILGTPGYIAPEVYRGKRADAKSDQFSFCVALYEALHGEKPFIEEGSTGRVPRHRARRRQLPADTECPAWLEAVLDRGLAYSPQGRYASIEHLIAALQADPVARRRRRLRGIGLAVGFVALAALAAFALLRDADGHRPRCGDSRSKLTGVWDDSRRSAVREAFISTGLGFAADTYARVASIMDAHSARWVKMRTAVCEASHGQDKRAEVVMDLRMRCLDRRLSELGVMAEVLAGDVDGEVLERAVGAASQLIDIATCADVEALSAAKPAPEDPDLRSRVERTRAQITRAEAMALAGKSREAMTLIGPAVEEARHIGWPVLLAEALYETAVLEDEMGKLAVAEALLFEALPLAGRAQSDLMVAEIYLRLLVVVSHGDGGFEAAQRLRPAVEAAVVRAGDRPRHRGKLERGLGALYDRKGDYSKALGHHREALAIYREAHGWGSIFVAAALNDVAIMLDLQGQHEEARRGHEQALAIEESLFGPEHPAVARDLNNLGTVLLELAEFDAAQAHFERGLAILKKFYGDSHPQVAVALVNLGKALSCTKKYPQAARSYQAAAVIWRTVEGIDRAHLATTLVNLGDDSRVQGNCDRALDHYVEALQVYEEVLGPDHPNVAYALVGIGVCKLTLGVARQAVPLFERALQLRRASDLDPSEVAEAEFGLARARWATGQRQQARELALRARATYGKAGDKESEEYAEVEAWITSHGPSAKPGRK